MPRAALRPAGFFLLRAPHLPVDALHVSPEASLAGVTANGARDTADFDAAVRAARDAASDQLRALVARPTVREAIAVASPSLSARLEVPARDARDREKTELSLTRYVARMAGRATPFGLFAGFARGVIDTAPDAATSLVLAPIADAVRFARLDMGVLVRVAEVASQDAEARARVATFVPNGAAYTLGDRIHYPELVVRGDARAYELAAITSAPEIEAALAHARTLGGATVDAIAAHLGEAHGLDTDDARGLVNELIDAQLLIARATPPLTGADPARALADAFLRDDPDSSVARALTQAIAAVGAASGTALAHAVAHESLAEAVRAIPGVPSEERSTHQVDLQRTAQATLGPRETHAIARGIEALWALAPDGSELAGFARAFTARYGDAEIPLTEALDDEAGVGAAVPGTVNVLEPAPLLDGLGLRKSGASAGATSRPFTARDALLLEKLERVWQRGEHTLVLEAGDLAPFAEKKRAPIPTSVAALVSLGRDTRDAISITLEGFSGASAGRLLGRFAAWDDALAADVRAHLAEEERAIAARDGAVLAEIVHMPDAARNGNILVRPVLRRYEIAFGCAAGVDDEHTLTLDDLRVSVRGERIVLRSVKLGREVRPRLSSAHNTEFRQLTAYRFLAALQGQDVTIGYAFQWGALSSARSLPRVILGGEGADAEIVLAPRQWSLTEVEVDALLALKHTTERVRAVLALREALTLPRFVGLREGESVLPIDLESPLAIDALVGSLTAKRRAVLVELRAEPSEQAARGDDGAYVTEAVVPFICGEVPDAIDVAPAPASARKPAARPRTFAPGSEWMLAKIYAPPSHLDAVLAGPIAAVARTAATRGDATHWFATRDADPDPHARLALHGDPSVLGGRLLPALHEALASSVARGHVRRVVLAPYDRAPNPWGGEAALDLAETLLGADSDAALGVLAVLAEDPMPTPRTRWGYALAGLARLYADLGGGIEHTLQLAREVARARRDELAIDVVRERAIADRFREERRAIDLTLAETELPAAVRAALDGRRAAWSNAAPRLAALPEGDRDRVIMRLGREWVRRIVRTRPLEHELVLATFIAKHAESVLARSRKAPRAATP